eukprot:9624004-Heterocapsa_arctica.AAC.1
MEARSDRESWKKTNLYWNEVFDYDVEGEEFINFLTETSYRNQWGGANQMAIFAKMENIQIYVYSHGIPCQTYAFDGEMSSIITLSVFYGATSTDGEHKQITTTYFFR